MVQPVTLQMLKGGTFGPCGRVLVWRCTIRILETPTFCQPSALNFNCRVAPKGTSINIPYSQQSTVHSSNTRLWRVHLYQRVQSNQVPVGEESFRHRNYLLEGGSRIWLWHLKGTQADTAKNLFLQTSNLTLSKRWVYRGGTRPHTFLPCPPSISQRGIWHLFLFCFFAQGKPKFKGKLKAHCCSSPAIVNTFLLYIKKAHIYLAKICQSFLFNMRII